MTVNMLLITIFAPKLFTLFGLTTNIGTIMYSVVFPISFILDTKFGRKDTIKGLNMVMFNVSLFILLQTLLSLFPVLQVNYHFGSLINELISKSNSVAVASLTAFYFSQLLFIIFVDKMKKYGWISIYIIASIIAQTADSLVFFPIAFNQLSPEIIWNIFLDSMIIKMVLVLLYIPLLTKIKTIKVNE